MENKVNLALITALASITLTSCGGQPLPLDGSTPPVPGGDTNRKATLQVINLLVDTDENRIDVEQKTSGEFTKIVSNFSYQAAPSSQALGWDNSDSQTFTIRTLLTNSQTQVIADTPFTFTHNSVQFLLAHGSAATTATNNGEKLSAVTPDSSSLLEGRTRVRFMHLMPNLEANIDVHIQEAGNFKKIVTNLTYENISPNSFTYIPNSEALVVTRTGVPVSNVDERVFSTSSFSPEINKGYIAFISQKTISDPAGDLYLVQEK